MALGLPLERREVSNTNQAPKHRAPVLESAEHEALSGERPQGSVFAGER